MSVRQVRFASFGSRLAAWVADAVPHALVPSIVGTLTGEWVYALAAYPVTGILWSILPEARTGSTIGKLLVGIKALDADAGTPVGIGRAAVRWLVKYVVCSVLPVGYLWYFRSPRHQTWHDTAAGTVVVTPVLDEQPPARERS